MLKHWLVVPAVAFGLAREELRDDLRTYLQELMAVDQAAQ